MLEENDALAAETAGEEDQDGTGLERGTRLGGADGLADLREENSVSYLVLVACGPRFSCLGGC